MSHFNCNICGTALIEDENGHYITECEHYQLESVDVRSVITKEINKSLDDIDNRFLDELLVLEQYLKSDESDWKGEPDGTEKIK